MLNRWQSTIVDAKGNIQPYAVLMIRRESDQALVTVYRDQEGTDPYPMGQVTADENGYAYFYATADLYRITSQVPAIDWRYVDVGASIATDIAQSALQLVEGAATDYAGDAPPDDPLSYQTWADTGTGTFKRRNAANSAWVIEGRLLRAHLPMYAQADVPALDIGPIYIIGKGPAEWVGAAYKVLMPDFPSNDDLQWLGTPIGKELSLHPNAPLPPKDDTRFRYIVLTAGLTGVGQYNEGVLTSETVTGSDPTITATAVVSLAGSPMDGQAIDLINTSRVFLRPGPAVGPIVDSQNASHTHSLAGQQGSYYMGTGTSGTNFIAGTASKTTGASGGNEARPRYIPRVYLMRIL